MKSVTLMTFNDREHAEPVVHRLHSAGFHTRLLDESGWQRRHLSERLASVKICVDESELQNARQKLSEWDSTDHFLKHAIRCPECVSGDVDYPQVTRKFVLPTIHAVLYKLGWVEKEFYCNTCHHT